MVKVTSNVRAVVAQIDRQIQRKIIESGVEYERILQEEFRSPKTGRVYGAETEVSFSGKGGGEREVTFAAAQTLDAGVPVANVVSFTANKGQKASKRLVKFVANRGKRWREGKRNSGMHRASAPGEAPAIQTGALRKGISRTITHVEPMRWSIQIGVSIQSGRGGPTGSSQRSIAHILEYGAKHIKERPAWRPALAKFQAGYRAKSAAKKSKS
jgi:hypothetical protein